MSKNRNQDEYTFLSIKVESYEAAVGVSVNINLRTSVPDSYSDEQPVFTPDMRIEIVGTSTYPEHRANVRYEITVYGERSEREQPKLKDVRALDKHGVPIYRPYRGRQIAVFRPPPGIAVLNKRRASEDLSLAIWVLPQVASDMLVLLTASQQLYAFVHERKVERQRWVQGLSLQTTDPAGT